MYPHGSKIFDKKKTTITQKISKYKYTITLIFLSSFILGTGIFLSYGDTTATLGAGVTISTGVKIWLGSTNANLTLLNDVVVDGFTVWGDALSLNGTLTPPSFILGSPYNYSSSLQQTNVTGVAGTEINLNVSSTTMLDGVHIYSTDGIFNDVTVTDSTKVNLNFSSLGNTTVYSPREPLAIIIDSVYYPEGTGWSWDAATNISSIDQPLNYTVTVLWSSGAAGNAYLREEILGTPFDTPGYYGVNITVFYDTFRLTYVNATTFPFWGNPFIVAAVTAPTGEEYFRTMIPDATTEYMYVPDIRYSDIDLYTLQFIDLTGQYSNASIAITVSDREISSGRIDASYKFESWLIAGQYFEVTLTSSNGNQFTAGGLNANPAATTITITIGSIDMDANRGPRTSTIIWVTQWVGTNVVIQYSDASNATTALTFTLFEQDFENKNYSIVYNHSYGANSSVTFTYAGNISRGYYAKVVYSHPSFGSMTETRPVLRTYLGFPMPNLPASIFGIDKIFPNTTNAWVYVISMMIVLGTSFVFGALYSAKGAVIVGVIGVFLSAAGWLPVTLTYAVAALAIAILSNYARERGD